VHDDQRDKSLGEFQARRIRGRGWRCCTDLHGGVASTRAVDEMSAMHGGTYLPHHLMLSPDLAKVALVQSTI